MGEIFHRTAPFSALPWTGERLTTETVGQTEIEHLHRYFFARALCRGLDVLDVASGEGYGSALLAQVARSVVGVEIEEVTVKHAQASYGKAGLTFLQGDARRIPCSDGSFDAVVSFETLEHFYEHDAFMAEVRRVLRPGGIFVISSPERDVYSPAGGTPNPYHAHELTHAEFGTLLRGSFEHVTMYAQRPLLGSAMIAEGLPSNPAPLLTFEKRSEAMFEASVGLPRPIYLVAIASDNAFVPSVGSLYVETSGVEALFAASAAAKREIATLTERLTQEGDYGQRVQAELNQRDAQLADQVAQAQEWHAQLVQRNQEQELLGAEVTSLTERVLNTESRLTEAHKVEIASLADQLQQRDARLQEAQVEARATADQLASRNTDYDALVQAHSALLKQRAERYARYEAAYRAEIERQTRQFAAHEETFRARLAAARTETAARRAEADKQLTRVVDLERHLQALLSSSSWRLTGPVRGLAARHPRTIARAKRLMERHPVVSRWTARFVRGAWRAVTLRQVRGAAKVRAIPTIEEPTREPEQLTVSTILPMRQMAMPVTNVERPEFRLERLKPAAHVPEEALPRGTGRRVLCVGHVMPYPPRAGNEYRIHRMVAWFARQGWEVLLVVCPLPHEMPSGPQLAAAAAIYPDLLVIDRAGTLYHNLADERRLLAGLELGRLTDIPKRLNEEDVDDPARTRLLGLVRTFCPDPLVELLLHLQDAFGPDLLLAEYIFMTRPFPLLKPLIRTAIDTIDVFSTKASKVERYRLSDGLAMSEEEEAVLLRRADILIAIQPEEARNIARLAPDRKVVSIGVDFAVSPPENVSSPRTAVLLVASGNHMNVKGLSDFLSFCWPLVCRDLPNAELLVAGAVGDSIRDAPGNVRVLGRVEDLGPLYSAARVVINPAFAGTGLKIKTVEALSHLRPVVCWPSGIDGLTEEAREFCHVATDWFSFAANLKLLLTDADAASAVEQARARLEHTFSPTVVYAPLAEALLDV